MTEVVGIAIYILSKRSWEYFLPLPVAAENIAPNASEQTPHGKAMKDNSRLLKTIKSDLPASVVVFFVALPLCLGIALASGAPLVSGIIAGIVGGIIVGSFSGSRLGVSGPAAGLAVIVLTAIDDLGSFNIFLVAVILAGLIQIALGFLKAGVIAYYFPSSVIAGMLAGIGIIIFLKQLPHAVGYDNDPEGDFSFAQLDGKTTFSEVLAALDVISLGPLIIAAVSLVILVMWQTRWFKRQKFLSLVPGSLVAVVVGVLLSVGFRSAPGFALTSKQLVRLPVTGDAAGLAELFTFPDFSGLLQPAVYKTAIVMAVVASLETLLCVEATDKLDPSKGLTPTNRELKAQGLGNVISGFVGGLPITQVIVRSSANIQAGGRSKIAAISHGLLLMISVVALPAIMNMIPLATLAAILLVVGYKLAKPSLFKKMFNKGATQFVPFIATILGIVFTDLLVGVGIGLAIAIVALLIEDFQLPFQVHHLPEKRGGTTRLELAQHVSFLNKASILRALNSVPAGGTVEIDGSGSVCIHDDVIEIIADFMVAAKTKNVEVILINLDLNSPPPSTRAHNSNRAAISIRPTEAQR